MGRCQFYENKAGSAPYCHCVYPVPLRGQKHKPKHKKLARF